VRCDAMRLRSLFHSSLVQFQFCFVLFHLLLVSERRSSRVNPRYQDDFMVLVYSRREK
jgi:hypothetical protein